MGRAITGIDDHLLNHLAEAIERAVGVRFNVAFLMESGARLIAPCLKKAAGRGVVTRILTGCYMSLTEPPALYHLLDVLGDKVEIRFYSDRLRSFHPKAYIFDYEDDAEIFIGSSNLSRSALTFGLEWNCSILRSDNPGGYTKFSQSFEQLYKEVAEPVDRDVLRRYAAGWRKPHFTRLEQQAEASLVDDETVYPRVAQIEALYELKTAREEGVGKGLVVAATGVGKTYIAAFDSVGYGRVLFLAHREEILHQAEAAYREVSPDSRKGFYTGERKDEGADICFASVQTLSRNNHLQNFEKDYFNYIVVDEFHHAAADSYMAVLNYFEPRFLLGLTATPFRMDNRDIFALCDDNVIYEIYLKDAINRDLLVPFKYYGLFDLTDYNQVEYRHGKYVVEDLERELSRRERADLVLEKYRMLAGKRVLGFCVSIKHAEYMADFFNRHGIAAASVHSGPHGGEYRLSRKVAVKALESGDLKVIFNIDIFNEGVDIPSIDTVLFLRPTESFVVFLQQLGRGLRKEEGKEHLMVLDFIGNYKRAHYIPALLAGENPTYPEKTIGKKANELEYPDLCQVHFDFQLLDLFEKLARSDPLKKRMVDDYFRIKDSLGRRPSRVDILNGSDIAMREFLKKGWLAFLHELEELDEAEKGWINTEAEKFLRFLEKTPMTKAYKVPTIGALLDGESIRKSVSLEIIGKNFMNFYEKSTLHQKDFRDKSNVGWESWGQDEFTDLAKRNPVHFLGKSDYFHYDEVNRQFCLPESLEPFLTPELAGHVKDILEFRRINYFRRRFREN